jgi:hypothetical protein
MKTLEEKYAEKERNDQALVANIRKACAQFMAATPAYYATTENERWMFHTLEANDHLSPTSAASWSECFALCRNRLESRPAERRQHSAAPVSRLTEKEIDSWSAKELERQLQSPRRAAEIEEVLSRKG